jgi:hypothetical protein
VPTHAVLGVALSARCHALAPLSCVAAEAYASARTLLGASRAPSVSALGRRPWPGSHQRVGVVARAGPAGVKVETHELRIGQQAWLPLAAHEQPHPLVP